MERTRSAPSPAAGWSDLPPELELRESSIEPGKTGLWSKGPIAIGRVYGPFLGQTVHVKPSKVTDCTIWQIRDVITRRVLHYVDASRPGRQNWMRHLKCSPFIYQKNVEPFQKGLQIYYKIIKELSPGEELITYLDESPLRIENDAQERQSAAESPQSGWNPILLIRRVKGNSPGSRKHKSSVTHQVEFKSAPPVPQTALSLVASGRKKTGSSRPESEDTKSNDLAPVDLLVQEVLGTKINVKTMVLDDYSKSSTSASNDKRSILKKPNNIPVSTKTFTRAAIASATASSSSAAGGSSKPSSASTIATRASPLPTSPSTRGISVPGTKKGLKGRKTPAPTAPAPSSSTAPPVCPPSPPAVDHDTQEYQFHVKDRHIIESNRHGKKVYRCDICAGVYRHAFSLKRHFIRTHINYNYLSAADIANCNITLNDRAPKRILSDHELKKSGKKREWRYLDLFRCHLCHGHFSSSGLLMDHINHHPDSPAQKRFACGQCEMTFSHKQNLVRHESVHSGVKPHSCRYCHKNFPSLANQRRHERIHEGLKPFDCRDCDSAFSQSGDLRKHVKKQHGDRFHPCNYCAKYFQMLDDLKAHEATHQGGASNNQMEFSRQIPIATESGFDFSRQFPGASAFGSNNAGNNSAGFNFGGNYGVENSSAPSAATLTSVKNQAIECLCTECPKKFSTFVNMCRHRRLTHHVVQGRRGKFIGSSSNGANNGIREARTGATGGIPLAADAPITESEFLMTVANRINDNLINYVDGKAFQLKYKPKRDSNTASSFSSSNGGEHSNKTPVWKAYNFPETFDMTSLTNNATDRCPPEAKGESQSLSSSRGYSGSYVVRDPGSLLRQYGLKVDESCYYYNNWSSDTSSEEYDEVSTSDDDEPVRIGRDTVPITYICSACGESFDSNVAIEDHKINNHPNVYCTHIEIEGEKAAPPELSLQFRSPVGALRQCPVPPVIRDPVSDDGENGASSKSRLTCTKCASSFEAVADLHLHILECGGDAEFVRQKTKFNATYSRRRGRPVKRQDITEPPVKPAKLRKTDESATNVDKEESTPNKETDKENHLKTTNGNYFNNKTKEIETSGVKTKETLAGIPCPPKSKENGASNKAKDNTKNTSAKDTSSKAKETSASKTKETTANKTKEPSPKGKETRSSKDPSPKSNTVKVSETIEKLKIIRDHKMKMEELALVIPNFTLCEGCNMSLACGDEFDDHCKTCPALIKIRNDANKDDTSECNFAPAIDEAAALAATTALATSVMASPVPTVPKNTCPQCMKLFSTPYNVKKHIREVCNKRLGIQLLPPTPPLVPAVIEPPKNSSPVVAPPRVPTPLPASVEVPAPLPVLESKINPTVPVEDIKRESSPKPKKGKKGKGKVEKGRTGKKILKVKVAAPIMLAKKQMEKESEEKASNSSVVLIPEKKSPILSNVIDEVDIIVPKPILTRSKVNIELDKPQPTSETVKEQPVLAAPVAIWSKLAADLSSHFPVEEPEVKPVLVEPETSVATSRKARKCAPRVPKFYPPVVRSLFSTPQPYMIINPLANFNNSDSNTPVSNETKKPAHDDDLEDDDVPLSSLRAAVSKDGKEDFIDKWANSMERSLSDQASVTPTPTRETRSKVAKNAIKEDIVVAPPTRPIEEKSSAKDDPTETPTLATPTKEERKDICNKKITANKASDKKEKGGKASAAKSSGKITDVTQTKVGAEKTPSKLTPVKKDPVKPLEPDCISPEDKLKLEKLARTIVLAPTANAMTPVIPNKVTRAGKSANESKSSTSKDKDSSNGKSALKEVVSATGSLVLKDCVPPTEILTSNGDVPTPDNSILKEDVSATANSILKSDVSPTGNLSLKDGVSNDGTTVIGKLNLEQSDPSTENSKVGDSAGSPGISNLKHGSPSTGTSTLKDNVPTASAESLSSLDVAQTTENSTLKDNAPSNGNSTSKDDTPSVEIVSPKFDVQCSSNSTLEDIGSTDGKSNLKHDVTSSVLKDDSPLSTDNSTSKNYDPATDNSDFKDDTPSTENSDFKDGTASTKNSDFKDDTPSTENSDFKDGTASTKNSDFKDDTASTKNSDFKDDTPSTENSALKDDTPNDGSVLKDDTTSTINSTLKDDTPSTVSSTLKDDTPSNESSSLKGDAPSNGSSTLKDDAPSSECSTLKNDANCTENSTLNDDTRSTLKDTDRSTGNSKVEVVDPFQFVSTTPPPTPEPVACASDSTPILAQVPIKREKRGESFDTELNSAAGKDDTDLDKSLSKRDQGDSKEVTKRSIKRKVKIEFDDSKFLPQQLHKCPQCLRKFSYLANYRKHMFDGCPLLRNKTKAKRRGCPVVVSPSVLKSQIEGLVIDLLRDQTPQIERVKKPSTPAMKPKKTGHSKSASTTKVTQSANNNNSPDVKPSTSSLTVMSAPSKTTILKTKTETPESIKSFKTKTKSSSGKTKNASLVSITAKPTPDSSDTAILPKPENPTDSPPSKVLPATTKQEEPIKEPIKSPAVNSILSAITKKLKTAPDLMKVNTMGDAKVDSKGSMVDDIFRPNVDPKAAAKDDSIVSQEAKSLLTPELNQTQSTSTPTTSNDESPISKPSVSPSCSQPPSCSQQTLCSSTSDGGQTSKFSSFSCNFCHKIFLSYWKLLQHRISHKLESAPDQDSPAFKISAEDAIINDFNKLSEKQRVDHSPVYRSTPSPPQPSITKLRTNLALNFQEKQLKNKKDSKDDNPDDPGHQNSTAKARDITEFKPLISKMEPAGFKSTLYSSLSNPISVRVDKLHDPKANNAIMLDPEQIKRKAVHLLKTNFGKRKAAVTKIKKKRVQKETVSVPTQDTNENSIVQTQKKASIEEPIGEVGKEKSPIKEPASAVPKELSPIEEPISEATKGRSPIKEPVSEVPKEKSPIKEPVSEVPKEKSPIKEHVSEVPKEKSPIKEHVSEVPKEKSPIKEPVSEVPKEKSPIKEPVSEVPKEKSPIKEPISEVPKQKSPIKEPLSDVPKEKSPIKEPVSEVPKEKSPIKEPASAIPKYMSPIKEHINDFPKRKAPNKNVISEVLKEESSIIELIIETPKEKSIIDESTSEAPSEKSPSKEPIEKSSNKEPSSKVPKEPTNEAPKGNSPNNEPISEDHKEKSLIKKPAREVTKGNKSLSKKSYSVSPTEKCTGKEPTSKTLIDKSPHKESISETQIEKSPSKEPISVPSKEKSPAKEARDVKKGKSSGKELGKEVTKIKPPLNEPTNEVTKGKSLSKEPANEIPKIGEVSKEKSPGKAKISKVKKGNSTKKEPVNETLKEKIKGKEPISETPKEKSPGKEPVSETPKEKSPSKEPVSETPKEKSPSKEPVSETPKENSLGKEPVSETPKQKSPSKEPVCETPNDKPQISEPSIDVPKEMSLSIDPISEVLEPIGEVENEKTSDTELFVEVKKGKSSNKKSIAGKVQKVTKSTSKKSIGKVQKKKPTSIKSVGKATKRLANKKAMGKVQKEKSTSKKSVTEVEEETSPNKEQEEISQSKKQISEANKEISSSKPSNSEVLKEMSLSKEPISEACKEKIPSKEPISVQQKETSPKKEPMKEVALKENSPCKDPTNQVQKETSLDKEPISELEQKDSFAITEVQEEEKSSRKGSRRGIKQTLAKSKKIIEVDQKFPHKESPVQEPQDEIHIEKSRSKEVVTVVAKQKASSKDAIDVVEEQKATCKESDVAAQKKKSLGQQSVDVVQKSPCIDTVDLAQKKTSPGKESAIVVPKSPCIEQLNNVQNEKIACQESLENPQGETSLSKESVDAVEKQKSTTIKSLGEIRKNEPISQESVDDVQKDLPSIEPPDRVKMSLRKVSPSVAKTNKPSKKRSPNQVQNEKPPNKNSLGEVTKQEAQNKKKRKSTSVKSLGELKTKKAKASSVLKKIRTTATVVTNELHIPVASKRVSPRPSAPQKSKEKDFKKTVSDTNKIEQEKNKIPSINFEKIEFEIPTVIIKTEDEATSSKSLEDLVQSDEEEIDESIPSTSHRLDHDNLSIPLSVSVSEIFGEMNQPTDKEMVSERHRANSGMSRSSSELDVTNLDTSGCSSTLSNAILAIPNEITINQKTLLSATRSKVNGTKTISKVVIPPIKKKATTKSKVKVQSFAIAKIRNTAKLNNAKSVPKETRKSSLATKLKTTLKKTAKVNSEPETELEDVEVEDDEELPVDEETGGDKKCQECERVFANKLNRDRHFRLAHKKKKPKRLTIVKGSSKRKRGDDKPEVTSPGDKNESNSNVTYRAVANQQIRSKKIKVESQTGRNSR